MTLTRRGISDRDPTFTVNMSIIPVAQYPMGDIFGPEWTAGHS